MHSWTEDFSHLFSLNGLISLLTLSILEIVLGIDNIIFISLAVDKLPRAQQKRARTIGLLLALAVRTVLLFFIGWIAGLKHPFFYLGAFGVSGKALILFGGGLFLLIKTWSEIREKMHHDEDEIGASPNNKKNTFNAIILQIIIIDFVFSFDSILAAVGLSGVILIMISAVIISMLLMILFSGKVADFINRNPGIKMIALVFLLVIGGILVAEGIVDCYNTTVPEKNHFEINKNYAYLALAFAVLVELFNIRERKIKRSKDFNQNP